jgi:phage terminase small subunit
MAGYSSIGARPNSTRLIAKDNIKQAIAVKMAELTAKVEHSFEIAVELLTERIGWLNKNAKAGNVQAIQAQTAIIRELNDIIGLHKQIIVDTREQKVLDEAQKDEAVRIASIRLHQESA